MAAWVDEQGVAVEYITAGVEDVGVAEFVAEGSGLIVV